MVDTEYITVKSVNMCVNKGKEWMNQLINQWVSQLRKTDKKYMRKN